MVLLFAGFHFAVASLGKIAAYETAPIVDRVWCTLPLQPTHSVGTGVHTKSKPHALVFRDFFSFNRVCGVEKS